MARKINVPNIATFDTGTLPFGAVVFLQSVQDGLKTLDEKVVYTDQVNIQPVTPRIRAKSAQGQVISISGINVAAGNDFATLVNDFQFLLQSHLDLIESYNALVNQLRGSE